MAVHAWACAGFSCTAFFSRMMAGRVGVGADLIVMSDQEFERKRQVPGTLPYWAAKEGLVLR
jgi:hypothetical protein